MARYFFNLHDGIAVPDAIGSEHADIQSARAEAIESITEGLKGKVLSNSDMSAWLMNVTDERGSTVIVLSFTAAVKVIDQLGAPIPSAS